MTPNRKGEADDDVVSAPTETPAQDADVVRDADGLIVDEYSDDNFVESDKMDALDQSTSLEGTDVLNSVPDNGDGIATVNLIEALSTDGADADMSLGTESLSAEEMEAAVIGHELKGAAAVTRDDEVHGERMFDSPDGKGRQTPDGEQN